MRLALGITLAVLMGSATSTYLLVQQPDPADGIDGYELVMGIGGILAAGAVIVVLLRRRR